MTQPARLVARLNFQLTAIPSEEDKTFLKKAINEIYVVESVEFVGNSKLVVGMRGSDGSSRVRRSVENMLFQYGIREYRNGLTVNALDGQTDNET